MEGRRIGRGTKCGNDGQGQEKEHGDLFAILRKQCSPEIRGGGGEIVQEVKALQVTDWFGPEHH